MNKLANLSLFVGTDQCNAYCGHCAGIPLRKYAPKEDGVIDEDLIGKTVRDCYVQGARYLSISSSGEPTLSPISVSKVFDLLQSFEGEGIKFSPINLYSNGIRIGEDKSFSDKYLPLWQSKGLTTIYITVHDIDEVKNAQVYGVRSYPSLKEILSRIHDANLLMRANLVLSKKTIGTAKEFQLATNYLLDLGVDYISAWPIRNLNDEVDEQWSPFESELNQMEKWMKSDPNLGDRLKLLRENSKVDYTSGKKLTLFPDGTLSNTWCNR